jgi:hypothetical protein
VLTSDLPAYRPYRGTPGLHLCEPSPAVVRARLHELLDAGAAARPALGGAGERDHAAIAAPWLELLLPPEGRLAPRARIATLAVVLLLALHVVFALVRWPVGAVGKRASAIAEYEERGAVAWLLRHFDDETRAIATWLGAEVPLDGCVLVRGFRQGAMQLLAPLLYPRLLVDVDLLAGRTPPAPVFTGGSRGAQGTPVVVGDGAGLRLEWR